MPRLRLRLLYVHAMTSNARIQRLIDEFNDGATTRGGGLNVAHGIAAVLRHIAETEYDLESWYAIPQRKLQDLAEALNAPTLLERAMAGDAKAARLFLRQAGFTDERGEWLPQYQPPNQA